MNVNIPTIQSLGVHQDPSVVELLLAEISRRNELALLHLVDKRIPEGMLDYIERRSARRPAVELPIFVTPASFDGTHAHLREGDDNPIYCLTKDVSPRGIGFTHDDPLDADWAVVSFDLLDTVAEMLLEIRWKNVDTDRYSLMSGGRFIGVIEHA